MTTVDARGLSCPQPIILTRNAIKAAQHGPVEVLGDTGTSRDNCTRTAQKEGWQVEVIEEDAGALGDGADGVVGHADGQPGLLGDHPVESPQERPAAGHHQARIDQVAGQFGRGLLQGSLDGVDDGGHGLLEGLADFGGVDHRLAGQAGDDVAALDLHLEFFLQRVGRPDLDLDSLGGGLADEEVVGAAHVLDDGVVHVVAGDADALGGDDVGEAQDRDLGGAAADVEDHRALGLLDGQPDADAGGARLLDQVHLAGAGALGGVAHRLALHRGDAAGNGDYQPGLGQSRAVVYLPDKVTEHLLGNFEVGDHTPLQRPDGLDGPGRLAQHVLGHHPHRVAVEEDLVGSLPDGHH